MCLMNYQKFFHFWYYKIYIIYLIFFFKCVIQLSFLKANMSHYFIWHVYNLGRIARIKLCNTIFTRKIICFPIKLFKKNDWMCVIYECRSTTSQCFIVECWNTCMRPMGILLPYSTEAHSWSTESRATGKSPPGPPTPRTLCTPCHVTIATHSLVNIDKYLFQELLMFISWWQFILQPSIAVSWFRDI